MNKSLKNAGWKIMAAALGLAALAQVASAQLGVDTYTPNRFLVVQQQGALAAIASGLWTNGPVYINPFMGRCALLLDSQTNAGGTLTATVETAPDLTNWVTLTNFALVSSTTSSILTNAYYGSTNLLATNNLLLQYTLTSPTAYSAGFATPYGSYLPLTNAAAVTVTADAFYLLGFNVNDQNTYLRIRWTGTGAATNGATSVGAVLIAVPK